MAEEGFKRRLTAILSADVAGYSRLMGDDEEATVRTLTTYGRKRGRATLWPTKKFLKGVNIIRR
jgi:hypothetical protein